MSLWDDLIGNTSADASNAAAADTYHKQQIATGGIKKAGDAYNTGMQGLSQQFQPYAQAGGSALQQLLSGLGLGGNGQDFTAAYQALPGYQSGLATGTKATSAALNAGNMGQSGKALKSLYRYGSDYENQRSGDYLNRLMGLSGMGQQATAQQVGTAGQGLQGQLGAYTSAYGGEMNSAGTIGQGQVAGAQAQQQGLGNLLNSATYLGGAALGKMPWGSMFGSK